MKKSLQTFLVAATAVTVSATAQAHDSTKHNRYSDHTHTERNMMDGGPRTAGRHGLYKGENEEAYYADTETNTHVYVDDGRKQYVDNGQRYLVDGEAYVKTSTDTSAWHNLSSRQVAHIQNRLGSRGYDVVVDGEMGPNTRAALRSYQRSNDLAVTGQVNSQTLASLGIKTRTIVQ